MAKNRGEAKFNELWDAWHTAIFKYCLHRLGDPHRAADCMQNTFYTLYEAMDNLDLNEQIGAWLFRVANNYVLKEFRNMKKEMRNIPYDQAAAEPSLVYEQEFNSRLTESQLYELRERLLSGISKDDAMLIRLMYDKKMPVKEIAEKIGISESAVYKRNKVLATKIKLLAKEIIDNL